MKLIDFNKSKNLKDLLDEMGAGLKPMESKNKWEETKLEELIKGGTIEIRDLSYLDTAKDGTLEYQGKKVIAYIRDQYSYYRNNEKGYKYHLSHCSTLEKAGAQNRNSRYLISLRTDGKFEVNKMGSNNSTESVLIPMKVCKNCLSKLDYKGYKINKEQIFNEFSLSEFFELYKHSEIKESEYKNVLTAKPNLYSKEWKKISNEMRFERGYICDECKIDMSAKENRKYCHVHHIDADKTNNDPNNLEVLCLECHNKKPMHNMSHTPDYSAFLIKKGFMSKRY
jgi:hypothetical protein